VYSAESYALGNDASERVVDLEEEEDGDLEEALRQSRLLR
jgi:hypothetical protein